MARENAPENTFSTLHLLYASIDQMSMLLHDDDAMTLVQQPSSMTTQDSWY